MNDSGLICKSNGKCRSGASSTYNSGSAVTRRGKTTGSWRLSLAKLTIQIQCDASVIYAHGFRVEPMAKSDTTSESLVGSYWSIWLP